MKKFYYFSEKNLKFLEIKHFKEKSFAVFAVSVIALSAIFSTVVYLVTNVSNKDISSLKEENKKLKNKIVVLSDQFSALEKELGTISKTSNDLRLAVNLNPVSVDEKQLGIGGNKFLDELYAELGSDVSDALKIADKVIRRFEFEKSQFSEISNKLKLNKALYESIPAIVPAAGQYSTESYGMRLHPILHIHKMHNGIDILNDVGTPVKATGKGVVTFVGGKGGYGLAIEIDHGFGYQTVYAHLSSVNVREGQTVVRGDIIAKSGNSGLSSGPHLHYEVIHNGQNYNPADFFFDEYSYFETNLAK